MRRTISVLVCATLLYPQVAAIAPARQTFDPNVPWGNPHHLVYPEISGNEEADTQNGFHRASMVEIFPHTPVYERYRQQIQRQPRGLGAGRIPLQQGRHLRSPTHERRPQFQVVRDSGPITGQPFIKAKSPYEELLHSRPRPSTSQAITAKIPSSFDATLSRMRKELKHSLPASTFKPVDYSEEEKHMNAVIHNELATACRLAQAAKRSTPSVKSPERIGSEEIAKYAISTYSGGPIGSIVTMKNVKDTATGTTILGEGQLTIRSILGIGGTGTVFLVSMDPSSQAALGFQEMALKFLNLSLPSEVLTADGNIINAHVASEIHEEMMAFLADETDPVRGMVRQTKARTSREVSAALEWAIPLYTAEFVGHPDDLLVVNGVVHIKNFLLSEVMLGDATTLISSGHAGATAKSLSMEAKQYVCSKLIDEVAAMHLGGRCHYDIKPENLFISLEGKPLLGDFGMTARVGERRECTNKITTTFMDPHHAMCFMHGGITRANVLYDAWSVGMSCFMLMLDGKMAYGIKMDEVAEATIRKISKLEVPCSLPRGPCPPSPGEELLQAGVSPFWAALIHLLLEPKHYERPSLAQIMKAYPKRSPSTTADLK